MCKYKNCINTSNQDSNDGESRLSSNEDTISIEEKKEDSNVEEYSSEEEEDSKEEAEEDSNEEEGENSNEELEIEVLTLIEQDDC